jgi:Cdc6-like AAA superfamily ATPase
MQRSCEESVDLRRYRRVLERAQERMRSGGASASMPCYPGVCLGREAELQAIEQWFHTHGAPLLTLIGPSGIGKTHLGCEVLQRKRALHLPCVYVNLTLLTSAEQILASLFHALDLSFPMESVWQRIAARLFARRCADCAGRF